MRGFRRAPGADHIVHAIELPELTRRRRPLAGTGAPAMGPTLAPGGEPNREEAPPPRRAGVGQGFGPARDFPGARPYFNGGARRPGDGAPQRRPAPPSSDRLTHGHRPEDGVPLREVEIPRPVNPPAPSTRTPAEAAPAVVPAAPSGDSARIELLERRIAKLARLLEEQAAQLQLRSDRPAGEAGVASVYAEVQGLRGDSEESQRKRALMSSIFEANRKLRERIGSLAQDAE